MCSRVVTEVEVPFSSTKVQMIGSSGGPMLSVVGRSLRASCSAEGDWWLSGSRDGGLVRLSWVILSLRSSHVFGGYASPVPRGSLLIDVS